MARKSPRIVYVTRDIERALGAVPGEDYQIVCNREPYAETIQALYPKYVHLLGNSDGPLSTAEMLGTEKFRAIMKSNEASIVVFKNSEVIEDIAKNNAWELLNPPAALSEKIENKITQTEWLGKLGEEYLPPHKVAPTKELRWQKKPLIVQWAHGHTGEGTLLVNSEKELSAIQIQFPDRPARATEFVNGPSFTVNVIADGKNVHIGNISYQITGLPPFTDNPFATVGNDWSLPHSLLDEDEIAKVQKIAREVGAKMNESGWRGLFGIDLMRNDETDEIFLIEINARQPASTTFESFLQQEYRREGLKGLTVFETHLQALRGEKIASEIVEINDGAQIIQRVTKEVRGFPAPAAVALEAAGYQLIPYANTDIGADLIRIQSLKGLMETHGKLNKRGKTIAEML